MAIKFNANNHRKYYQYDCMLCIPKLGTIEQTAYVRIRILSFLTSIKSLLHVLLDAKGLNRISLYGNLQIPKVPNYSPRIMNLNPLQLGTLQ